MFTFKKITKTNGFDENNLDNARQNNYAWSMNELNDYIYVGTGRNVPLNIMQNIFEDIITPESITPLEQSNLPEIWRYKKDGTLPWERVFTAPIEADISGFRFMIPFEAIGKENSLYIGSYGGKFQLYKSSTGTDWEFVESSLEIPGTSSRGMVVINNTLYVATVDEQTQSEIPVLFSNRDPEMDIWTNILDTSNPDFDESKNPKGAISNMQLFNGKLYVATSSKDGCAVWRSNGEIPEMNEWTLIVDKGFGDLENKYTLAIGVYNEYLYVSATKKLPLAWLLPVGCDIIRIDEFDNWQLVVGGEPITPVNPTKGVRTDSISGYGSGFDNPFNVYGWQIQQYSNKLIITTFDDSSNMQVILDTLLLNREAIEEEIGQVATGIIINTYRSIVEILAIIDYPIGFDFYESDDGVEFRAEFKGGLCNPDNYGGRMLFVDDNNEMFLGTANPFEGCEVWKVKLFGQNCSLYNETNFSSYVPERVYDKSYEEYFITVNSEIRKNYAVLKDNMDKIIRFIPENLYHVFI